MKAFFLHGQNSVEGSFLVLTHVPLHFWGPITSVLQLLCNFQIKNIKRCPFIFVGLLWWKTTLNLYSYPFWPRPYFIQGDSKSLFLFALIVRNENSFKLSLKLFSLVSSQGLLHLNIRSYRGDPFELFWP